MSESFDVIIIGGGINGTGVARDCALRGLKTLLIEKKDLSGGTTGASSGMVHGGLRYLLYDVKTTKTSSRDSGAIQKMAPFLHFRIPFLFLLKKGKGPPIEFMETFFEVYDRYAKLKNGKKHTRLDGEAIFKIEPGLSSVVTHAISFDEWGVDPYRLCVLNAKDAAQNGAKILLQAEVVGLLMENKEGQRRVTGVCVRDEGGKESAFSGKVILNLAGPWVPKIAKMAGLKIQLRPAKGVHLVFDRRISNMGFATETIDGRSVFLMPYQNTSILGTTDDDFYGDPDHLEVTHDEVAYLLEAVEQVFPDIRKYRVIGTYAGIRPTLYEWGKNEEDLSREHKIFDHEQENVPGCISMAGGKLATFRLMSQELTDLVCKKLRVRKKCETHRRPLPGAEKTISSEQMEAWSMQHEIAPYALWRLHARHGAGMERILRLVEQNPAYKRMICTAEPVLEAEIRYVIDQEWASSLDDLGRRTRLGWGNCQGTDCAWPAALILNELLGRDPQKETRIFLQKRWQSIMPHLQGESIAQEELKQSFIEALGVGA